MSKREEGRQNSIIHEGAPADPKDDTNEHADEKVEIQQPDGSAAPRAKKN